MAITWVSTSWAFLVNRGDNTWEVPEIIIGFQWALHKLQLLLLLFLTSEDYYRVYMRKCAQTLWHNVCYIVKSSKMLSWLYVISTYQFQFNLLEPQRSNLFPLQSEWPSERNPHHHSSDFSFKGQITERLFMALKREGMVPRHSAILISFI